MAFYVSEFYSVVRTLRHFAAYRVGEMRTEPAVTLSSAARSALCERYYFLPCIDALFKIDGDVHF